ncbi:MAG: GGDEF domain-containing protein, partial [Candidatus Thiodiazotropha sp. (ex Lucinoma borealis)]|nr:GGDEF domain-containing protein [Candidatus Thiodiazotropha sp. (ex Lucinoma borealis)]
LKIIIYETNTCKKKGLAIEKNVVILPFSQSRYGGEEFAVVLNDTNMAGAHLLAKRIRKNIENLRIKSLKDVRITLSVGVTIMDQHDTQQSLFERADAALYQAKENGRNQVVTA